MLKCHYNNLFLCLGLQRPSHLSPWWWSSPVFQENSCQVNFKPKITSKWGGKTEFFGGCPHWQGEQKNLAAESRTHSMVWVAMDFEARAIPSPPTGPGCSSRPGSQSQSVPMAARPVARWHSSVITLSELWAVPGSDLGRAGAVPHSHTALGSSPFAFSCVWAPSTKALADFVCQTLGDQGEEQRAVLGAWEVPGTPRVPQYWQHNLGKCSLKPSK